MVAMPKATASPVCYAGSTKRFGYEFKILVDRHAGQNIERVLKSRLSFALSFGSTLTDSYVQGRTKESGVLTKLGEIKSFD